MWSVYLLTIRWANRPGPGSPLAIGIAGLGAAITTSPGACGLHAGAGASRPWYWSVAGWPGSTGSGVTAVTSSAGWGSGCGAGMGWDSWPGCADPPAACDRCLLQHGQTYLWTKCSTTNNDAGR